MSRAETLLRTNPVPAVREVDMGAIRERVHRIFYPYMFGSGDRGVRGKSQRSGERREDNSRLAAKMVRWISLANIHDGADVYFFTATFAEDVDSFDEAVKRWQRFRRLLIKECPNIAYCAVPEIQKRRQAETGIAVWHFHALLFNLPPEKDLELIYGKMKTKKGGWAWRWKWRFTELWSEANNNGEVNRCDISRAESVIAVACYLVKYVTKDFGTVPFGRRNYFCGGKLKRPVVTRERGQVARDLQDGYTHEWTGEDRNGNPVIFRSYGEVKLTK